MHRLRAILKRCIAYSLYFSGALWIYRSALLRDRAIVLTYHRVLPAAADSFSSLGIVVSPDIFTANMRFLRRHFMPLSAEEFQRCLDAGRFPKGACLVTFDDGWHDNEAHALPILQSLDVPVTLFVATGYIGTSKTFWQERMTRQLFALSRNPAMGRSALAKLGIADVCDASSDETARNNVRGFVDRLKLSTTAEIERVAAAVSTASQPTGFDDDLGDDRFLDWTALVRMASTGLVTIGSHAHSHVPLPRLGRGTATSDLQQSVREITRHGLPAPTIFSFPNGDHDASTLDCLAEAGLTTAFTTDHGYVAVGADPRCLPRVNIHDGAASTPPEFLCRILGIF
ncbi:MAG: polysaccharide deacetylase family protein [Steroidobacteraceae bacterium]